MLNCLLLLSMVHEYAYFFMNIFGNRSITFECFWFCLRNWRRAIHYVAVCVYSLTNDSRAHMLLLDAVLNVTWLQTESRDSSLRHRLTSHLTTRCRHSDVSSLRTIERLHGNVVCDDVTAASPVAWQPTSSGHASSATTARGTTTTVATTTTTTTTVTTGRLSTTTVRTTTTTATTTAKTTARTTSDTTTTQHLLTTSNNDTTSHATTDAVQLNNGSSVAANSSSSASSLLYLVSTSSPVISNITTSSNSTVRATNSSVTNSTSS